MVMALAVFILVIAIIVIQRNRRSSEQISVVLESEKEFGEELQDLQDAIRLSKDGVCTNSKRFSNQLTDLCDAISGLNDQLTDLVSYKHRLKRYRERKRIV